MWQDAYSKVRKLVSRMTILEKVNLTTGTGFASGPCSGNTGSVPRLGIPSFCLQDGPNGVHATDFVTHYPSGLATGSTFNKALMYLKGKAIGREFRGKNVHMALAPVVGPIGLKAQGGRNWESFGADPYLQGVGGGQMVKGMQEEGVVAVVKHFIANEQEYFRQEGEHPADIVASISSDIDERTLHEVFMWPFADVVRAGCGGIVCSFNRVNGTYSCENSYLLGKMLKEELGFQGFVVSDWGAQHSGVNSALAGLDMSMPGDIYDEWLEGKSFWGSSLTKAVYNNSVSQERLDDMASRILAPFFASAGLYLPMENEVPNFSSWTLDTYGPQFPIQKTGPIVQQNKHVDVRSTFGDDIALGLAREAIILLKNEGNSLPIRKNIRKMLVAGLGAGQDPDGLNCRDGTCSNGFLTSGWGSAAVRNALTITPFQAIAQKAHLRGILVEYNHNNWNLEAIDQMQEVDMAVVVVNAASGEGHIEIDGNYGDRKNISLWHNGDELIKHVAEKCSRTVVIVNAVGPVDMEPWINHKNVVAVLFTAPLGQFGGMALAEVLFGEVNPSGKLPFTIAKKKLHYVPLVTESEDEEPHDDMKRGFYLDYRYFDKHSILPRFCFGHGLSYSEFVFSDLRIEEKNQPLQFLSPGKNYLPVTSRNKEDNRDPEEALFPENLQRQPGFIFPYLEEESLSDLDEEDFSYPPGYSTTHQSTPSTAGGGLGGNPSLWTQVYDISARVTNIGRYGGAYSVQLYIEFPNSEFISPPKILRGFDKVYLEPHLNGTVHFPILQRDLSVWNTEKAQWVIQKGVYRISIASSSEKVELYGEIDLSG